MMLTNTTTPLIMFKRLLRNTFQKLAVSNEEEFSYEARVETKLFNASHWDKDDVNLNQDDNWISSVGQAMILFD